MSLSYQEVKIIITDELEKFSKGLEERLARGMQKGMDLVTYEVSERLKQIEEDQARIMRHLGMK